MGTTIEKGNIFKGQNWRIEIFSGCVRSYIKGEEEIDKTLVLYTVYTVHRI